MISARISDDFVCTDGARIERSVYLETDSGYNPDILQDLSKRCVELWATQHSYLEEESSDG